MGDSGSLALVNYYFYGAGDGSGRADVFTKGTPFMAHAAFFLLKYRDNFVNYHQDVAGTYGNTQPAAITLLSIYFGYLSQEGIPPFTIL
jgi:hypothetical protein